MSIGWKPGDVAMVECSDGEWRRAAFRPMDLQNEDRWQFSDRAHRRVAESFARPLVVIDPENSREIENLLLNYGVVADPANVERCVKRMQTALRIWAESVAYPKPDEPLGDGSVVEDRVGHRWVRVAGPHSERATPWRRQGASARNWSQVNCVRILSEGVSA